MATGPKKLTPLQLRFIEEYLVDLSPGKAARRAGYSAASSAVAGSRLLSRPLVQEQIQKRMQDRAQRTEIDQDRVMKELARIAFSDARKVMSWGPDGVRLIDSDTLNDEHAAIVAEASESTSKDGGSIKIKLHDKLKALELIGRNLGMWKDKVEHTGKNGMPLAPPVINIGFGNGGPGDSSAEGS